MSTTAPRLLGLQDLTFEASECFAFTSAATRKTALMSAPTGFLARKMNEISVCCRSVSRLETQTNLLSRAMSKDAKVESSKGQKDREKTRSISRSEDEDEDSTRESKESRNLSETLFVAVIAQGILSIPSKRTTLISICNFICKRFPHFDKEKGPGWRNSVRHNLSSNDCFEQASRAENGKGHYWMVHPKDLPGFSKGNSYQRKTYKTKTTTLQSFHELWQTWTCLDSQYLCKLIPVSVH